MSRNKRRKSKREKIPILSFFSGGGFLDMGFEMGNFDVVWTNEHDTIFSELYAQGYTSWKKSINKKNPKQNISCTLSIEKLNSGKVIDMAFKGKRPKFFGIVGGPPCQDFSNNGQKAGFKGEKGKLTDKFYSLIRNIKPDFFVMENVTGLIRMKKNISRFEKTLGTLKSLYHYDYKILNSLEFGVPQNRSRVFVIGFRKKYFPRNFDFDFSWPTDDKYKNALQKYDWPIRNKFGVKIAKDKNIPAELCVYKCLVPEYKKNQIPNGNEYFPSQSAKMKRISEGNTFRASFRRLHRFRYSPTACYGNNEVHLHPSLPRRLSLREAMRIQGIPDSYVLSSTASLTKKFRLVGNGVPVPLAKVVAVSVKKYLDTHIIDKNGQMVKGKKKRSNVQNKSKKHKV